MDERDPMDMICCTVAATRYSQLGARIERAGCRIVEVRLDLVPGGLSSPRAYIEEASSTGARVLATLRSSEEGGGYSGPVGDKISLLLKALEWGAWMIDVEYRFPGVDEVLASAPGRVLLSAHYNFAPEPELVYAALGEMIRDGASIAKLVARVERVGENWRLVGANARWPGRAIVFGMGRRGILSRILAPLAGAPFTYAALDKPAAPGQPGYWEVVEAWRMLGVVG
ncbi:MAG: type I 3-dehydroquinate dehydratase [Desulfurococcales archaeon]|nr:type I 3-dehydroquinate dehydratase [Desulfurococcales archaeon]